MSLSSRLECPACKTPFPVRRLFLVVSRRNATCPGCGVRLYFNSHLAAVVLGVVLYLAIGIAVLDAFPDSLYIAIPVGFAVIVAVVSGFVLWTTRVSLGDPKP